MQIIYHKTKRLSIYDVIYYIILKLFNLSRGENQMNIFDIPKTHFISHRGFTPLAPENSLPSFYYAGLLGQWAIETDLHLTRDGKIVCCHNDTIDEYCNQTGKISSQTHHKRKVLYNQSKKEQKMLVSEQF